MRFCPTHSAALTAAFAVAGAQATEITVDLSANDDGRFTEFQSEAFAEIGLEPDGMYDLTDPTNMFGSVDAFPSEGDWDAVGTLTLDGDPTGIGVETFNINAAVFDFNTFVVGPLVSPFAFAGGGDYSTAVAVTSGTVEFTNGLVTDIDLDADVSFTFPASAPYDGSLDIVDSVFTLLVDDTENLNFFGTLVPVQQIWDFDGTASSPTFIPEPATAAILAGSLGLLVRSRRWRS